MLEKTRTLMVRPVGWKKGADAGMVFFTHDIDKDEELRRYELKMDKDVWEDMDNPDTITLTIEPGDKLNG